jgi:hypothetical protein
MDGMYYCLANTLLPTDRLVYFLCFRRNAHYIDRTLQHVYTGETGIPFVAEVVDQCNAIITHYVKVYSHARQSRARMFQVSCVKRV